LRPGPQAHLQLKPSPPGPDNDGLIAPTAQPFSKKEKKNNPTAHLVIAILLKKKSGHCDAKSNRKVP